MEDISGRASSAPGRGVRRGKSGKEGDAGEPRGHGDGGGHGEGGGHSGAGERGDPEAGDEVLRAPDLFHPGAVYRRGRVVVRPAGPWTRTVHTLLRHLSAGGFAGAPRVVGSGFDADGRETLTYVEGESAQPGPWTVEGAAAVGQLLRDLHAATASYEPPPDAVWYPWFGRTLGGARRVIGHCDTGPWNIVTRGGLPVAFIDWDWAGPVDPLEEVAQTCWLNARLFDDVVAAREGLPPLAERARHLRAMIDGYGLPARQRRGFVDRMVEYAVHFAAYQADDATAVLSKLGNGTAPASAPAPAGTTAPEGTPAPKKPAPEKKPAPGSAAPPAETAAPEADATPGGTIAPPAGTTAPQGATPELVWAVAWPARSAAWMLRHRAALQNAVA